MAVITQLIFFFFINFSKIFVRAAAAGVDRCSLPSSAVHRERGPVAQRGAVLRQVAVPRLRPVCQRGPVRQSGLARRCSPVLSAEPSAGALPSPDGDPSSSAHRGYPYSCRRLSTLAEPSAQATDVLRVDSRVEYERGRRKTDLVNF